MSANPRQARQAPTAAPTIGDGLGSAWASLWASLTAPFAHPPVLGRVAEAAEVRAMADRIRARDPAFASDLYAAANRHESLDDLTV